MSYFSAVSPRAGTWPGKFTGRLRLGGRYGPGRLFRRRAIFNELMASQQRRNARLSLIDNLFVDYLLRRPLTRSRADIMAEQARQFSGIMANFWKYRPANRPMNILKYRGRGKSGPQRIRRFRASRGV